MAGTAIVAIPAEDEYVWQVSSEKKPHLTILSLGETTPEQNKLIAEFLEHVANTSLHRFGLSVDRRGELGDENADVLFFRERDYQLKKVKQARSYLLANDAIKKAYDSTPQFEGWTPHLTLGYPESPAKPDDRDYPGIHWINFDRLALWTGEFDGPEFLLEEDLVDEVAMSDDHEASVLIGVAAVGNILGHKAVGGGGTKTFNESKVKRDGRGQFAKKSGDTSKKDEKWEKELWLTQLGVANKASDRLKAMTKEYAKENGLTEEDMEDPANVKPSFINDVIEVMNKAADDPVFYSPSGEKKVEFVFDSESQALKAVSKKRNVRHDGLAFLGQSFLAHYGVKGMRWGVRRRSSGGGSSPLSDDAALARLLLSQKASSVSNNDIQTALNRMRLETQFKELQASTTPVTRMTKAKRFVGRLLGEVGSEQVTRVAKGAASVAVENALQKKSPSTSDFAAQVGKRIVPKKK